MNEYKNEPVSEDFLKKYCGKMVEATTKLEAWLDAL
jgi:hypothetical protein